MEFHELVPSRGRLIVVSGPSGVGKDTVLYALMGEERSLAGLKKCITATTRAPRAGEVEGRDYFFLARDEFEARIARSEFLEHAVYNRDYYGTPKAYVDEQRAQGVDVLLKIEVQGALQVKEVVPDAILIFLAPPSWEELERRLRNRATDRPEEVERRLAIARSEMATAARYDYLVVNDDVARAAALLESVILAERCRIICSKSA